MRDERRPTTIEEALRDCTEALTSPNVEVVPTNALMVDMLKDPREAQALLTPEPK